MAAFAPQFVHEILLRLAKAAYLQNLNPATDLPAGYDVVGQIGADPAAAAQLVAAISIDREALVTMLARSGPGFGWVVQNVSTGVAAVTFRGTQSVDDWLHDLDFVLSTYQPVPSSGTVHAGFQLYYMMIRASVLSLLARVAPACRRLILTGHSLGAALSELAAPDVLHSLNSRW